MGGSFVDLQKPMRELDGKPCAAVGQSGLMALYDSLFTQVPIRMPIPFSTSFFYFMIKIWFGWFFIASDATMLFPLRASKQERTL